MQAVVAAVATVILAQVQLSSAQGSNVTQCVRGREWTVNSLGQTPCYVAAWLESACSGIPVFTPVLPSGNQYLAPTAIQADPCWCNTVTYSTISACAACQGRLFLPYAAWIVNCFTLGQLGIFPRPIPSNVQVPSWAYLDISQTNFNFSVTGAREAAATAAITTPLPPSTAPLPSSSISRITISNSENSSPTSPVAAATGSTSSATSSPDSNSGLSGGAIAGIVVGVLVAVFALLLFILWRLVWNRKRRQPRPTLLDDSGPVSLPPAHARSVSDPASIITPYTYGNSTPLLNPSSPGASTMYTTPHGRNSLDGVGRPVTLLSSQTGPMSHNFGYTGAAEI